MTSRQDGGDADPRLEDFEEEKMTRSNLKTRRNLSLNYLPESNAFILVELRFAINDFYHFRVSYMNQFTMANPSSGNTPFL